LRRKSPIPLLLSSSFPAKYHSGFLFPCGQRTRVSLPFHISRNPNATAEGIGRCLSSQRN
jgi:hypothetical protein